MCKRLVGNFRQFTRQTRSRYESALFVVQTDMFIVQTDPFTHTNSVNHSIDERIERPRSFLNFSLINRTFRAFDQRQSENQC